MRTIKLFEDFYSTLPQSMSMEDVKKLSPDEFLKVAEETLERGKGTDQNEFYTLVNIYTTSKPQVARGTEGAKFVRKLGDFMEKYGLDPDGDIPAFDPETRPSAIRKRNLDYRIEKLEREALIIKNKMSTLTKELSGIETTLRELRSERKKMD